MNCPHRPDLSRPNGWSLALLHPPDLRAVLFGRGHSEAGEAQENEESPETSVLTISLLPVAPLKDQNLGDCANDG